MVAVSSVLGNRVIAWGGLEEVGVARKEDGEGGGTGTAASAVRRWMEMRCDAVR